MFDRRSAHMLFVGCNLFLTLACANALAQNSASASQDPDATPMSAQESGADNAGMHAMMDESVAERQSFDTYSVLEDGQPGAPGEFELQLDFGWETVSEEHDPVLFTPELKFTLAGNEFLENTQLTLAAPAVFGLGGVDGNADLEFGWMQRWVAEDGCMPTLATLAEIRLPTGYHSSGVDGTLTGIIAKDCGPGTIYFNAFAKTANGHNVEDLRAFQWGLRAGYKWLISDDFALIGDYVHETSEEEGHGDINLLEVSAEWKIDEHVSFGPGVFVGLDDNEETPNFGAGIRLNISF